MDGLNFPKKCDGLNFPKKCDGLNFPKKCDGLNFPKKSKSADNGLNFPKKSKSSDNGLNFPKKAKNADNGLNFPKKANGANIVAHSAPTVTHSVLTAAYSVPTAGYSVSTAGYSVPSVANSSFPTVAHSVAEEHDSEYFANGEAESCDRFTKAFVNEDFNKQIDFDEVFADSFPNVVAQANSQIDNDDETEELNISSVDINVHNATQESTSSSLWNASHIIYGSFHQNDDRFSELSRGFQCTCNAICMLAYMTVNEIHNSSSLDEILHDGDSLYKKVVSDLKAQKKFSHALLSLDEMPECFKTKTQDFFITKQPILSGVLVQNFEERGLPTLHCALESALTQVSSVLLTVGAICSAVVKHNDKYMFFDSHSHGEDCLSASDGSSILIDFPSLEDLISYLYALYDSMSIDTSLQFDLLPLTVRQNEQLSSNITQSGNLLEAYFRDQNLRQQEKAHLNTDKSTSAKKKNNRKMYFKLFKSKARLNPYFKAKERAEKQKARQKPGVLEKE
ncbi:MAG: hypothetical protein JAY75_12290, partial [Candidatus Thiodiazotropha taylori]|nr:hypothetical protein [Candidatus Thiodiazotropha taylori]MCW4308997.1 hypothetical protein [Candidatus Thiodiazotropha endolucinida]